MTSGIMSLGRLVNTGALYNVTDPITTAQGELVFTVWRKFFFQAGTVDYSIGGGTAVLNTDYDGSLSALSGTLTFSALEICKHVRIQTFGTGGATNKPASGAAQVTVNCTLSNATGIGRIEDYVGTGTIQSGKVFYYSASGSDGNTGTAASPFAYAGASNGIQAKITASNGSGGNSAGMLLRLNRGDTWTLTSASGNVLSVGADKGGTLANPMILGAYGSIGSEDPIITNDATYPSLAYLLAIGGASSGSNDSNFIFEDFILQPGSEPPTSRDFIRFGTGTVNPANRTCQRLTLRNPSNYTMECGINGSSSNFFTNFTLQFCDLSGSAQGFLHIGTNVTILGNYFHDLNREPVRQWAIYSGHCVDAYIYANKFLRNKQNIKLRSGTNVNWKWNYFDQTGSIGKATVTAATNETQCVLTISQDPTDPIPAGRLLVGQYFTLQGFAGTGWATGGNPSGYGGNSGFVIIIADLGGGQYRTNWDTSTYGAFSGGTPTVYSGGNLNVAFGYDTVVSAADAESLNCTYESNVQIGSSGFGFGVAEGGVPAWGQGFINFTAKNNLIQVSKFNPQGWSGGFGLFFSSPYVNGMQIYNNTFLIDGLDYSPLFMPFTQATGGNVGPIGPVYIKNNIFKRLNIAGATTYMANYGQSSITGASVLALITQDYNLWNDSTSNKFASVNSGSNYTTMANFTAAFPSQEAHGVSTGVTLGPYLGLGNFLPPNGSAAYGAGQSGLVTTDFIGNSRPTTPTIGGIEVSP